MRQILLCTAILGLSAITGCDKPRQAKPAEEPAVTVQQPREQEVPDYLDLTGTVAPSRTVDLVARVSGYLRSADFQEGNIVDAGKELFVIEPEPYEQQLLLAEAALLRAKAEYERQLDLKKEDATSAATVERWLSERDQAAAQVEIAKLNLGYTRVAAPFAGRIGRRYVDPGNLVGPNVNTKLATVEQITPIYINFNLNERDVLYIRARMRERNLYTKPKPGQEPVLIGVQNGEGYPYKGTLDFIDTGLDTASGTMQLRATYPNEKEELLPGLFARVRLPMGKPQKLLVIPGEAIGNDQEGDYVLVVEANGTVARRSIEKGPPAGDGCGIRKGLSPGDRVITNGLTRVHPGMRVRISGPSSAEAKTTTGSGH